MHTYKPPTNNFSENYCVEDIKNIAIFSALSEKEMVKILSVVKKTTVLRKEIIVNQQDTCNELYILFSGSARSTMFSIKGKEICFQHLSQGDIFGELSAVDNLPRTTNIIAETDCQLGIIQADHLLKLMKNHPPIMICILKQISSLVRLLSSRVYEYSALSARDRTRAEIIRQAKCSMVNEQKAVITDMPIHEDIANRIAYHRSAVTREFSYLKKKGLIEKEGKTVIVPNIQALSATLVESII